MDKQEIVIRGRVISSQQPLFICAETGVTCNYDMTISKKLIDVVAAAGADAIKFIFWFPDELLADKKTTYTYSTVFGERTENMFEMLSKLKFSFEQWKELKAYADERGVIFFATINTPSGIDYARRLNLDAYKISSWDFNYVDLWEELAKDKKTIIVDTGPVNANEFQKVVSITRRYGASILPVHCFHTEDSSEMNMHSISFLKKNFNTQVGYSADSVSSDSDFIAVALGATFIEKRLTLSSSLPGHHHVLSLEPEEFIQYVKTIRNAQKSLGVEDLIPSRSDLEARKKYFRSLVAARSLTAGTILEKEMLIAKRPGYGISPEHVQYFVGKKIKTDLLIDQPVVWSDVE